MSTYRMLVNMARFDSFVIIYYNADFGYVFHVHVEMLCTEHIIFFSLGNSFPIVLFGEE